MNWYKLSQFRSEDEFISYHKTRSTPPVKRSNSFKWYKIENYPNLLFTEYFGGLRIEFRSGSLEKHKIVAFDGDRAVGIASEHVDIRLPEGETGDGYWVDSKYQKLGIGLRLMILFRSQFSNDRRIGEMSPSGENLVRSYYRHLKKNELEDILYGLSHWTEIEPSIKRVEVLKSLNSDDPVILDMIEIWESGHGVLSKPDRIKSIQRVINSQISKSASVAKRDYDIVNDRLQDLVKSLEERYPGLILFAWFGVGRYVEVAKLEVPKEKRNHGIGSNVMRSIQDFAKENNVKVVVRPEAEFGKKKNLEDFYRNLGFVHNRGRNRNYQVSSPFAPTMYWSPNE